MSIYHGRYDKEQDKSIITVESDDGSQLELNPRTDLRNHTTDGSFSWGYGGSGPSQTALALLAHYYGNDTQAVQMYMPFKWFYVANLDPDEDWRLSTNEITAILSEIGCESKPDIMESNSSARKYDA